MILVLIRFDSSSRVVVISFRLFLLRSNICVTPIGYSEGRRHFQVAARRRRSPINANNMTITFEELPATLIQFIAYHLRQDPDAAPSTVRASKNCPCVRLGPHATTTETWQEETLEDPYLDAALQLSMTSNRCRRIVFDQAKGGIRIRGGLCHDSWTRTRRQSDVARSKVR